MRSNKYPHKKKQETIPPQIPLSLSFNFPALLTGGLPRVGLLLSWSPTLAGPCGVANSRISPVLLEAEAGWSPSLLGLVIITIWWSWPSSKLPEFSKVSKSASRSSDVCPVTKVSDIAVYQGEGSALDFGGGGGGC